VRTFIFTINTGRFGDEVVIQAPDVEAAAKRLTRTQRKKGYYVREFIGTKQRRANAEAEGLPFPVPVKHYKKRREA
jgi:predicted DNA-binding WGR domain protein